MPTVAAIALETLLEPGSSSSVHNLPLKERQAQPIFLSRKTRQESNVSSAATRNNNLSQEAGSRAKSAANGYYISPQLYVTPEPTLIVPTGGISSSSPTYVVNHKRRGLPRPPPPFPFKESETKTENTNYVVPEEEVFSEGVRSIENRDCNENSAGKECLEVAIEDDLDGSFFDPRELMSTMSGSDTEDAGGGFRRCGSGRCHTPLSGQSEFYDASEDFLSEGSSVRASLEADLHALRINLFEEMERRSKAEDALGHAQNVLHMMGRLLSGTAHLDIDSADQFCQEILFTRMVSDALVTDLAQLQNHEIARLRDRLQYYEAVNQEMSQRNQEVIEQGRRQRQRKKVRRKWLVGCIGVAVTVGASLMAYSYLSAAHGGGAAAESSTLALISDSHEPVEGHSA